MRASKRIDAIMAELTEIWKSVPDQRFGQFMSNLLGDIAYKHEVNDIFFPEDNKWIAWLQEYNTKAGE